METLYDKYRAYLVKNLNEKFGLETIRNAENNFIYTAFVRLKQVRDPFKNNPNNQELYDKIMPLLYELISTCEKYTSNEK